MPFPACFIKRVVIQISSRRLYWKFLISNEKNIYISMNITDSQQGTTVCMDGVEPTFEQLKRGADALARTDHVEQSGRFQGLVEPVT